MKKKTFYIPAREAVIKNNRKQKTGNFLICRQFFKGKHF
jgi:hypothetical protein